MDSNKITIGIDLSINSTGICVCRGEEYIYYIICSKLTKKAINYLDHNDLINYIIYDKETPDKSDDYITKERIKTNNIYKIVNIIKEIIDKHNPTTAIIEGVSFGSCGDVIGLAGLNYSVRMMLRDRNIYINIISPTENKKYATGNGQADKGVMISAWQKIDKRIATVPDYIKIDDLADAFFLSKYECSL